MRFQIFHFRIACVSCPSLYQALRKLKPDSCTVVILEYDRRFERFKKDFVFYDYNQPLDLPNEMERAFDLVVLDPPFLSEDCLCKVAVTAKYIAKEKILLCTGNESSDWLLLSSWVIFIGTRTYDCYLTWLLLSQVHS